MPKLPLPHLQSSIFNTMSATLSSSIIPIATSNIIFMRITNRQSYISKVLTRYIHSPGSHQSTQFRVTDSLVTSLLERLVMLKMTKKYTNNMILMSRYKGQLHGGKNAKKIGQGPPPPTFRAMLERKRFFLCEVFPNCDYPNLPNFYPDIWLMWSPVNRLSLIHI